MGQPEGQKKLILMVLPQDFLEFYLLSLYLNDLATSLTCALRGHSQQIMAKFWQREGRLRGFGTDTGEGVQNPKKIWLT